MPGLVGLITNKGREFAERQLRRMVEAQNHESFYRCGTWTDESLGIYAGWVIRDDASPQPLPIKDGLHERVLLFSGEEYSFPLGQIAANNGHAPRQGQDGAYLIDRVTTDVAFPSSLNGRFQGLLVDKRAKVATLFNDRYGMHRLYYHEAQDCFYFAAEAKAILSVRPELRVIDPRSMAELVSCGCVLENRSVFKGIGVLPPASAWAFENAALARRACYFDPKEWEDQGSLDLESYYVQLREVFARNIPKYFAGSHPIAVSLTGGLDSRMIMAWLNAAPGSVPCFSFGGMFRDCQDVAVARHVAQVCDQSHQVIPVGQEFLRGFDHHAERTVFLTDACVDVSHTADLYINQLARQIAPVRMTGNYGGEVLRSIRAFKSVEPPAGLFQEDFLSYLGAAKQTYTSLINVHPLSFSVFRQAPWHHYGLQALEQTQLALRSPYLDNDLVKIVFRAPRSTLASNDISLRLIQDGNPALRRIRTDRGLAGGAGRLTSAVRRQYLEFTFKAEYAYDYGMPQWVARTDHAFSRLHLEKLFLGRHKFYHYRLWYRDQLAEYVRGMLLDSRTLNRPYLQRQTVERVVDGHLRGDRNFTTAIHKILTLEHLHRLFIDTR